MRKVVSIYDDTQKPVYDVSNIIGNKSFGQVIYKRKSLSQRFFETLSGEKEVKFTYSIKTKEDISKLLDMLHGQTGSYIFFHVFAEFVVTSPEAFQVILKKLPFCKETIALSVHGEIAGVVFPEVLSYTKYLKGCQNCKNTKEMLENLPYQTMETDAMCNMNHLSDFLQYITGGFDARYFNSLSGDEYTVTKTSVNKTKIKSEYTYYHLLPDEMKRWFILPYNYRETDTTASYTMERLHMTDVAIRWVHGAFEEEEFESLMKKIFYFITSRKKKSISEKECQVAVRKLYLDKIRQRNKELREHPMYPVLAKYISISTDFSNLEEIESYYEKIFCSVEKKLCHGRQVVIGHGDLCFSNMLYNKETETLKLIDVKGALEEEELWMEPFYDLAKLSHSICGRYDFFNNDMYELRMSSELKIELVLEFDNMTYKDIFKRYLAANGYDYQIIRILEASLFLSMLPLHMDNPRKVFGFLLNAINILKEAESCMTD